MDRRYCQRGELVVFTMTKNTACPGPRAKAVRPAPRGENYTYEIDKFWIVEDVCGDGTLLVRTRRGKVHRIDADDPRLRPASWMKRFLYRYRFPVTRQASALPSGGLDAL